MDCNRQEAVRAKMLAEQKLASQDYVSAKKFALKAQQIFPGLENMAHIMAVIDVHMAALAKIGASNEMDWYRILQVEPNADEVVVKKQYRKLALFLHPDKNKFAGAESAFKLIGEALQILSDKTRRLVYNAKRRQTHMRTKHRTPVCKPRGSGVDAYSPGNNGHGVKAARAQPQLHPFAFWTACPFCHMRYQYLRKFENQNLLCPHCRNAFIARDLSQAHPAQDPFSQTGQPKACPDPTSRTAGVNGFADASQKFSKTTTPINTSGADSNGSQAAENVEEKIELRRKAQELLRSEEIELRRKTQELLRSMELQKELARKEEQMFSTNPPDCASKSPNETKSAEKAEVKVLDCAEKVEVKATNCAEKADVKVTDCAEKAEVKVPNCADKANVKVTDCAEKADIKVTDCAANLPKGSKAAEGAKAEKEPLRKSEDIRRLMELQRDLAKQKEQLKSTTTTEKIHGKSAQSKMEEQAGTTENVNKVHAEKGSSKAKRKRGKKKYESSSSDTEEEDNWERVTADWKREEHPRRSTRSKGNVTYKCNESDDDFQNTPLKKKARAENEAGTPLQDLEGSDADKKLADLSKTAIRIKLNLQCASASASMVHEAGNMTCLEEGQKPKPSGSQTDCLNSRGGSMASYGVQDAEFHNFDEGREEKDVEVGQVWALYDDKDGMPKYYMKVKNVQSRTPFKVSVAWFEMRKPCEDICELLDMDLSFTCGEFIMSSSQTMYSTNSFSHLVNWEKAGKGIIRVYPKRGEIWCLYVDWKCGQQVFRADDIPSMYCMVEILSDCNEFCGVSAMLLKKVVGYKALFQSSDAGVIKVPFLEVLRFSHQVPAYKIKGNEAPNLPKGCWELDPAAVPASLICPDAAPWIRS